MRLVSRAGASRWNHQARPRRSAARRIAPVLSLLCRCGPAAQPRLSPSSNGNPYGVSASDLLEAIAHAVERLDHLEIVVDRLELLAQPLDVAVDGAVVDIDLVVIGRVHQRVAALDDARALRQRLQDQELGDRQRHRLALPGAGMALRIHHQLAALDHLGRLGGCGGAVLRRRRGAAPP